MTVREELERQEHKRLNPKAAFADQSKGRPFGDKEREMDLRTCYQRDIDRIVHSKAFRRLMHKTQVFLSPEHDHYRTRLTHTLEVTQIARTICRSLRLNEDLAEAIGLGHDLGHTPFGHAGEAMMQQCFSPDFTHYKQSIRVVEKLEKNGVASKEEILEACKSQDFNNYDMIERIDNDDDRYYILELPQPHPK